MQTEGYADLATALAKDERTVFMRFMVDWDGDGNYENAYADISDLVASYSIEAATLTNNLPEQVNAIGGFSSSELSLTLAGQRIAEELEVYELMSPYFATSPLYGKSVVNTLVKADMLIFDTDFFSQPVIIRQFTGFIREFTFDRANLTVSIVASDVNDLVSNPVTLPLWAVAQPNAYMDTTISGYPFPGATEIEGQWAVEECLRQGGRPTGPETSPYAQSYQSFNGSLLPSVGLTSMAFTAPVVVEHRIQTHDAYAWQQGPFGLCPKYHNYYNASNLWDIHGQNFSAHRTKDRFVPPSPQTYSGNMSLAWSGWVYSDGTGVIGGNASAWNTTGSASVTNASFTQYLDWSSKETAQTSGVLISIEKDGRLRINIQDLFDGTANSRQRWWTGASQPAGWHFYHILLRFDMNNIYASWKVDGVAKTLTATQAVNSSYVFGFFNGLPAYADTGKTIPVLTYEAQIPIQHVQWEQKGDWTLDYRTGMELPPTRDGLPLSVITQQSLLKLNWLPDTVDKPSWELLGELAAAEFAATYTNEFGQVFYAPRTDLNTDLVGVTDANFEQSDDRLMGTNINPSIDQYRNAVSLTAVQRTSVLDTVYTNEEPLQYPVAIGARPRFLMTLNEEYQVANDIRAVTIDKDLAETDGNYGIYSTVSAVRDDDLHSGASGWQISTYTVLPRSYYIDMYGGPTPTGTQRGAYIGSYAGGQDASLRIMGRRYGDSVSRRNLVSDTTLIARDGIRVLTLDDNSWLQNDSSRDTAAGGLLVDIREVRPVIDGVSIPVDPRVQLRDIVSFTSSVGITGKLFTQVIGKTISGSNGSLSMALALRLVQTPGEWILGDTSLSVLGSSTVL